MYYEENMVMYVISYCKDKYKKIYNIGSARVKMTLGDVVFIYIVYIASI